MPLNQSATFYSASITHRTSGTEGAVVQRLQRDRDKQAAEGQCMLGWVCVRFYKAMEIVMDFSGVRVRVYVQIHVLIQI